MEDVARQALRVDADEHVLRPGEVALHQRDVVLAAQLLAEGDGGELAVGGREPHRGRALDELLVATAVLDQVGDRDQLQPVALAVRHEVADSGHRPVLVHDLADDAGGDEPRETREVDRGLRLAGALEHAAFACAQREDVPRPDEVIRALAAVDRDLNRSRTVVGRDPGRDPLTSFDGDREGGSERRLVAVRHRLEPELVAPLLGQAQADEPAAVRGHEVDRLGRRELRRDGEVAFVLAVGGVDGDHELPGADVLDRLLDGRERRLLLQACGHPADRTRGYRAAKRSTYLARTSTSRLTSSPGSTEPSVVASSVWRTSATSNSSSVSPAIVSETPSTAIEPFSTQ